MTCLGDAGLSDGNDTGEEQGPSLLEQPHSSQKASPSLIPSTNIYQVPPACKILGWVLSVQEW